MRFGLLLVSAIVVGSVAGFGLTWHEARRIECQYGLDDEEPSQPPEGPLPSASVAGSTKFDFGTLGHEKSGDHTFVIRNLGEGDLSLWLGDFSCGKCIQSSVQSAEVEPGKSLDLKVTYASRKPGPAFNEYVEFYTNDPNHSVLRFEVVGYVTQAVRPSVDELTLGDLSVDDATTGSFRIHGFFGEQLEIVSHEFSDPDLADHFQVTTRPLDAAEFADEPQVRVAHEVALKVKPGLPLGPVNQTIRFTVRTDEPHVVEVPIRGKVVSDIAFLGGPNLRPATNSLYLGTVRHTEGKQVTLRILVKGKKHDQVRLTVGKIDPDDILQATLGEATEIADGAMHMVPLTVGVVKDSRIANRLGTQQGKSGRIFIETTHPQAKQLMLFVRFATE